ncbi:MAG TPA: MmcQ/YjbR family DNA-binding protein [Bryobacteraceae bacterium]|jgi:hypothetical protein
MPGVEEGTSYGTAALKVKGKLMIRLREEGDVIVVKMPFELRTELMEGDPATYFITDHYTNYEWVLARLPKLDPAALPDLLQTAYRTATKPARAKQKPRPDLLS